MKLWNPVLFIKSSCFFIFKKKLVIYMIFISLMLQNHANQWSRSNSLECEVMNEASLKCLIYRTRP